MSYRAELTDKIPITCFQYGTKALDKITKAILGHIENKVPPPKSYIGGDGMFFRGMYRKSTSLAHCLSPLAILKKMFVFFCSVSDMKLGMMDVGIFCKEPRFGISTEKGTVTILQ